MPLRRDKDNPADFLHIDAIFKFPTCGGQRCHSKQINPRWANKNPKKTQGQISIDLAQI